MLRRVLLGATYDSVAADYGITRTAVERRVKALAAGLCRSGGVAELGEGSVAFVKRLRAARESILALLDSPPRTAPRRDRILSMEEVTRGALHIRRRSAEPWRDVALFYLLFVSGARPLEVARLRVGDYLNPDGSVRRRSELPAQASLTGRARPLFFASKRLDEALDNYLGERVARGHGAGVSGLHRGLDPASHLFLSSTGAPFAVTVRGEGERRRSLCRTMLETYRKLFRYARLEDLSALSVRRTVAARLFDRGADEDQVGLLLGIGERRAVRALVPRVPADLSKLVVDLV